MIKLIDKNLQNPGDAKIMNSQLLSYVNQFLDEYPFMSLVSSRNADVCLRGKLCFKGIISTGKKVEDSYRLEIIIPVKYPKDVPIVKEIGGKIPRHEDYHVNGNGTLCLGSPLRLMLKISKNPSITGFVKNCLIPYLFAVSQKIRNEVNFAFGELEHGIQGLFNDYSNLLGLKDQSDIKQAVKLLSIKKRLANKQECPCGCGKRLGLCKFRNKVNALRKISDKSWFKTHYNSIIIFEEREKINEQIPT